MFWANSDVVIVEKNTDILILLVWAYTKHNIDHTWYFKYGNEKYANIGTIFAYFEEEICLSLPGFHAITGSDTISYFYRIGKVSEGLVFLVYAFLIYKGFALTKFITIIFLLKNNILTSNRMF